VATAQTGIFAVGTSSHCFLEFTRRPGSEPELITASVGATVYPLDASDADTLLRHADHAMYGGKQSGRVHGPHIQVVPSGAGGHRSG